jgi:hypothetical protein
MTALIILLIAIVAAWGGEVGLGVALVLVALLAWGVDRDQHPA